MLASGRVCVWESSWMILPQLCRSYQMGLRCRKLDRNPPESPDHNGGLSPSLVGATSSPAITTSTTSRNGPCKYATATVLEPTVSSSSLGPPTADPYVHFGLTPHHQYTHHLQPTGPPGPPSWNRFSEPFSQRVGCLPTTGGPRDHHPLSGNEHPLLGEMDKTASGMTSQLSQHHQPTLDLYRGGYSAPEFHHSNRRVTPHQPTSFLESASDSGFGHCGGAAKTFGPLGMQSCPVFGHMAPVSSAQDRACSRPVGHVSSGSGSLLIRLSLSFCRKQSEDRELSRILLAVQNADT
ncbi:hypothetical protein AVEN_104207-1 [Araneus ventricosus]|uniref:Uncharacterized protein n=1 Tax=Araneus ventricosus TaxID=182803 RepID=A0A4Y2IN38_ARAVE|nr:hypothetical protein AVEN_104207-1 [Araneus ventricosus]